MGEFGDSGIHGRSGRVAFPRTNVMPVMPARRPEAADAPARRAAQEVRRSEEAMMENVLGELKLMGCLRRRGEERRGPVWRQMLSRINVIVAEAPREQGSKIWHLIGQHSPHQQCVDEWNFSH